MSNVACLARRGARAVGVFGGHGGDDPEQSLSYVGGLQYAAVFTQRTWSAYLSTGLSWSAVRLRASPSVPLVMRRLAGWLHFSGPG